MSNYTHPMQQQYTKRINELSVKYSQTLIELNELITILTQNQIKFFSRDDVSKFSKLCNPFDKMKFSDAVLHLELIYVQVNLEVNYFIVKFTGKSSKSSEVQPFPLKKILKNHSIQSCINDFVKKLNLIYGKKTFWFRALGGVIGTNIIKKQILCKKICKIFTNTCHSACIERFISHLTNDKSTDINWDNLAQKLRINNTKLPPIQVPDQINKNHSPNSPLAQKNQRYIDYTNERYFKISTFLSTTKFQSPNPQGRIQHNEKQEFGSRSPSPQLQVPRKRLKTMIEKPVFAIESANLGDKFKNRLSVIHSQKNRYTTMTPRKNYKTSMQNY